MSLKYFVTLIFCGNVVAQELNLALNKPAIQTPTYQNNIANLSVDGNIYTQSIADAFASSICYWQVDLGAVYDIMEIVIINTLKGGSDSASTQYIFTTISLDFTIIYDESDMWSQNNQTIAPGETFTMKKHPASTALDSGRHITIWKFIKPPNVHNALALAEVMVHGTLVTPSTSTTQPTQPTTMATQSTQPSQPTQPAQPTQPTTTTTTKPTQPTSPTSPTLATKILPPTLETPITSNLTLNTSPVKSCESLLVESKIEIENLKKLAMGLGIGLGLGLIICLLIIAKLYHSSKLNTKDKNDNTNIYEHTRPKEEENAYAGLNLEKL